ncbi:MAG: pseudouridine synthase [Clostridia bacterium]|nr:pseudouridine synthase [Clostridia bacterium]
MERLQKYLAHAGVASRRHCEELILKGKVAVNGQVVTELGTKVDPVKDQVLVNGKPVSIAKTKVYILLYKPGGYVTTVKDPEGRKTVIDLLKGIRERVYPVGRLDYDTEGLLILTNDGELTHALTHPSRQVDKTYLAIVQGVPAEDGLEQLRRGIRLEDGMTAPAGVRLLKVEQDKAWLEITIHEGRNRQVRRMCEQIGYPVLFLKRVRLGFLTLDGLTVGKYRTLRPREVAKLRAMAGIQG